MMIRRSGLAGMVLAMALLGGCAATVYGPVPPPPPGWHGEGWARHVRRCMRRYPNYDPRTDLIERRGGSFACPL